VPVAEHGALEVEAPPSDRRKASAQFVPGNREPRRRALAFSHTKLSLREMGTPSPLFLSTTDPLA
jgi:hypothetical protein